ncbi:MAG: beta-CASP ribonuclease aCPSF1 [Candidatus Nanohalarchaeota archaeon]|nr:MAG: beta-CASP ribonuclease aCPSF1 [Candidatus Nanohaloarchaeota archaeon]
MDKAEFMDNLPPSAMITNFTFEGADVVLYTKNKNFFLEGGRELRELISRIRKRIIIMPDKAIMMPQKQAEKKLKKILPKNAIVEAVLFEPEFGRVIIRAQKPGLIIGKSGDIFKKIKKEIFWMPSVQRVTKDASAIVNKARDIVHEEAKFRYKFLNDIGKKIQLNKGPKKEWVRISFLGGSREVGRSCLFLQTKESRVLFDCGVGQSTNEVNPFVDAPEFDIDALDAVIISHAHIDHSGFVPYLYEYGYKGPVYSTLPTRDIMTLLQLDMFDIQKKEGTPFYSTKSIREQIKHSITLGYNEVCDITGDMRIVLQNAGHILGSSQTHVHIGEGLYNILYTGDLNMYSWMFDPAYTNFNRVESMIIESTYGGIHDKTPTKEEAEANLLSAVKETIKKKGKLLIPSFAVGRAQEIMLILTKILPKAKIDIPVYLDGMIWNVTKIHIAYPEFLSKQLQEKMLKGITPFEDKMFRKVQTRDQREEVINEGGSSIIIATSGMINGGPILEYLRNMIGDKKHTLAFVGYQAEGTLGNRIQSGLSEISLEDKKGEMKYTPIKMDVTTIRGISGHADRKGLCRYIEKLTANPKKIMFNHGERGKSINLSSFIHKEYNVETSVPKNLDAVRLI